MAERVQCSQLTTKWPRPPRGIEPIGAQYSSLWLAGCIFGSSSSLIHPAPCKPRLLRPRLHSCLTWPPQVSTGLAWWWQVTGQLISFGLVILFPWLFNSSSKVEAHNTWHGILILLLCPFTHHCLRPSTPQPFNLSLFRPVAHQPSDSPLPVCLFDPVQHSGWHGVLGYLLMSWKSFWLSSYSIANAPIP